MALPNRELVRQALLIWPSTGLPASLQEIVFRIVHYPGRSGDDSLLRVVPLELAGAAGAIVAFVRRRQLDPTGRRLLVGAFGWYVVSVAVLAVADYRPNRYYVPALPALAILAAPLAWEAERWIAERAPDRAALGRSAIAAALAIVLAAPGLAAYGRWMAGATYYLPGDQATMARVVPAGAVTVGYETPLLLMSAPVETIVQPGDPPVVNTGDLYATRGARYYMADAGTTFGAVATAHPAAWAQRRQVACGHWELTVMCLYELP